MARGGSMGPWGEGVAVYVGGGLIRPHGSGSASAALAFAEAVRAVGREWPVTVGSARRPAHLHPVGARVALLGEAPKCKLRGQDADWKLPPPTRRAGVRRLPGVRVTVTTAPTPSRFERVPTSWNVTEWPCAGSA